MRGMLNYSDSLSGMMYFEFMRCPNDNSLTLREECRLRVFENRVLRRIFGPKRDEVTGACECGEEPSGSIKRGEFLDQLQTS